MTIPQKNADAILWVSSHLPAWQADPTAIGLSVQDVTDLAAALGTASSNQSAWNTIKDEARSASALYRSSTGDMRTLAASMVTTIRAYAKASADPQSVYSTADIPAPATPTPAPAPGTPFDFKATLNPSGELTFDFKCANAKGLQVTYKIERQENGGQNPFVFLTNAKERSFGDSSFTPGTSTLVYRITAQTTTKDGVAGVFLVRLGAGNQATVMPVGEGEQAA